MTFNHIVLVATFVLPAVFPIYAFNSDVVDIAGKQRMLTQKITKDILLLGLRHNEQQQVLDIEQSVLQFENTLQYLKQDEDIKNSPIDHDVLIQEIEQVKAHWFSFAQVVESIVNNKYVTRAQVNFVFDNNELLLQKSESLLGLFTEIKPLEEDPVKIYRINLADRQRMLSQKIAKQALSICYHLDFFNTKNSVLDSTAEFNYVLEGLLNGNAALGLEEVSSIVEVDALSETEEFWRDYLFVVEPMLAMDFSVCSESLVANIANNSEQVLRSMDEVVLVTKDE